MQINEILRRCDHTVLDRKAGLSEVLQCVDDAIAFGCASACIPSCYVKEAAAHAGGRTKICTVIGFPNGYTPTEIKLAELRLALADGADEIDTVVNLCHLRDGRYDLIKEELRRLKAAAGDRVLKVIIETCLLTEEEKIALCSLVTESGADYIKTSTGFSTAGATFADVELFSRHIGEGMKIKAAGGISSLDDAEKFIALGADRLGTSRIVKIAKAKLKEDGNNGNDQDTSY